MRHWHIAVSYWHIAVSTDKCIVQPSPENLLREDGNEPRDSQLDNMQTEIFEHLAPNGIFFFLPNPSPQG